MRQTSFSQKKLYLDDLIRKTQQEQFVKMSNQLYNNRKKQYNKFIYLKINIKKN